jgi:hypothetical protein
MALLIVPLLYPDLDELLNFLLSHFRITSGLLSTQNPVFDFTQCCFRTLMDDLSLVIVSRGQKRDEREQTAANVGV